MATSPHSIHHAAAAGYQANADRYVLGRPDYPAEIAVWLREVLELQPGKTVIDLGAGTGKFTPRLLETGANVIAVEPVAQMLEKLAAAFPQVKTLAGTAESLPLPDESVDAVVCAQSFHWFATRQALAEIQRVLKPGGKLGLVWNMRDARVGWVRKLNQIVDRHEGDAPRFYTGEWRRLFPSPGFAQLQEQVFMLGHSGAPEDVIYNRVRSTSFIAALPQQQQEQVIEQIRQLVVEEEELRGKDTLTVPYQTCAFFTTKAG
ncbi:class I SAM-dependent methyltransferase [Serratia fonticola]|uniref:Class I SAM-dependent methyltransferase n=1 Tax=Serratia fonticola TaxID=47917 RepID=A0AAE7JVG9_SERFO|nr:class I SAM-dependent methyltransferase [Serratia fonticola]QKJ61178.1 class I SAM-dependent methyltransferase [Serratia fonticola]